MSVKNALGPIRNLLTEAAEYAGPEDDDLSDNAAIWQAISEAQDCITDLMELLRTVKTCAKAWDDPDSAADAPDIATDIARAWREFAG